MSTTIRDINGNKTPHTLRHFTFHITSVIHYHTDSTGLFVCDYQGGTLSAFIRPETIAEERAVQTAKLIGTPRPE